MTTTDANIIIRCSECRDHTEQGIQDMILHILEYHPQYSPLEADTYALKWLDAAYDELDLQEEKMTKAYRNG